MIVHDIHRDTRIIFASINLVAVNYQFDRPNFSGI